VRSADQSRIREWRWSSTARIPPHPLPVGRRGTIVHSGITIFLGQLLLLTHGRGSNRSILLLLLLLLLLLTWSHWSLLRLLLPILHLHLLLTLHLLLLRSWLRSLVVSSVSVGPQLLLLHPYLSLSLRLSMSLRRSRLSLSMGMLHQLLMLGLLSGMLLSLLSGDELLLLLWRLRLRLTQSRLCLHLVQWHRSISSHQPPLRLGHAHPISLNEPLLPRIRISIVFIVFHNTTLTLSSSDIAPTSLPARPSVCAEWCMIWGFT
jgi:hypothetical protein